MEQRRLNEFVHSVLINASQMAYVEEAGGTLMLLENFNELFRYLVRDAQLETLFNEIEVLHRYITIQRVRYGDRFSVCLKNGPENKSIYIRRLSVVDFFDSILSSVMERQELFVNFTFVFEEQGEHCCLNMVLESENKTENFKKVL